MKVLKFGGTSVGSSQNIQKVIAILDEKSIDDNVICVVSAIGGITDKLLNAGQLAKNKDKPSIVISLGGFNDIINKIWGKQNDIINRLWGDKKSINNPLYNFLKQFLIFRAIKRFFLAYKNYDLVNDSLPVQSDEENDIYPLY